MSDINDLLNTCITTDS